MKAYSLLISALIISLAFYSCKKSNADSTTKPPPVSTWTLNGVSYTGDSSYAFTGFMGTPNGVLGTNSSGVDVGSYDSGAFDEIDLYFAKTPTASGTYTVIQQDNAIPTSSTEVSIDVISHYQRAGGYAFYSIGATGDTVNISVSGNKITASFANISVTDGGINEKVSGTIVAKEQ